MTIVLNLKHPPVVKFYETGNHPSYGEIKTIIIKQFRIREGGVRRRSTAKFTLQFIRGLHLHTLSTTKLYPQEGLNLARKGF